MVREWIVGPVVLYFYPGRNIVIRNGELYLFIEAIKH